MGVRPSWAHNVIRCDSWEELLEYVKTEGVKFGWELRDPPPNSITAGMLEEFRKCGVPENELPPKYKELWATRSTNLTIISSKPLWDRKDPIRVGWAGVSYMFNAKAFVPEYRNLFLIKFDDID